MAVTDEARYLLYQRLETQLGHEEATILMDHLPYGGWANLATKQDIVRFNDRIDVQGKILRHEMAVGFAAVDARFSDMDVRFSEIDVRFAQIDVRFETVHKHMDVRFEKVDGQLAVLAERIDKALAEGMGEGHKLQWTFVMAMLTLFVAIAGVVAGQLVT